MRHIKLTSYQVDVHFDVGKTLAEGVEKRPFVLVVVVGVGLKQRGFGYTGFKCSRGWIASRKKNCVAKESANTGDTTPRLLLADTAGCICKGEKKAPPE
ncbi:MAG: hypothetical protein MUC59_05970 [Saprospiraceae bacterium]|nr:hypothetical protein [Saprospiraceae bacterium]